LANEARANERGVTPLGRLVAYGIAAVEPGLFGLGPIPAVKQALARAGWSNGDVERIEINEAFAVITLVGGSSREPVPGLTPDRNCLCLQWSASAQRPAAPEVSWVCDLHPP
jgi:Thiolase, C-terminal domain